MKWDIDLCFSCLRREFCCVQVDYIYRKHGNLEIWPSNARVCPVPSDLFSSADVDPERPPTYSGTAGGGVRSAQMKQKEKHIYFLRHRAESLYLDPDDEAKGMNITEGLYHYHSC